MQNKETQHTCICMREVDVEPSNHAKSSDRKQWTWMTQTKANLTEGRPIPTETSEKKVSGSTERQNEDKRTKPPSQTIHSCVHGSSLA